MLPAFLSAYPYVDVRLVEAYSGTLTDWIASGEIESAVVTVPPAHLGLETTHFFRDQLFLVTRAGAVTQGGSCRRGSHMGGLGYITGAELGKMKLILPSSRHSLRRIAEHAVRLGVTASGRILEVDGRLGTLELVRHSDWATILPKFAVLDEIRVGTLRAKPILKPELWLDYFLIHTKSATPSRACREFFERLKHALEAKGKQMKVYNSAHCLETS